MPAATSAPPASSFAYPGRQHTLSGITFDAKPGERVAIVGHTGAGKSTLMSLLVRFYDPSGGRIEIDGVDLRDLKLRSLREQISVVLQEPLLFSGTIGENIRYGRLDATQEEIEAAARAANAHDFIAALPEGYETELGEGGSHISGGERQRISVARAFLKDAPILILDEPTSSIDSRTEGVILDSLDDLMEGRTSFIVAHRLSTVRHADQILVLDKGRVVERGTHEELLRVGNVYRQLHEAQNRERKRRRPVNGGNGDDAGRGHGRRGRDLAPGHRGRLAMAGGGRPKIVLLGMMTPMPVAGVVWQNLHYLLGFERLGFEAYYVETHARTPSMLMSNREDDSSALAAEFIASVMRRFGLADRWAFRALHDDRRCYGMSELQLERLYGEAELLINLHGGTQPLPELAATGRLVYLETDPVQMQLELRHGLRETIDFLEPHVRLLHLRRELGQPRLPPAGQRALPVPPDPPAGRARPLARPLGAARRRSTRRSATGARTGAR